MEYLFIILFQLLGVGFQVIQKVKAIADSTPDEEETFVVVFKLFLRKEPVTLVLSGLILTLHLSIHYAIDVYAAHVREIPYYVLISFSIALIMGYAGQRLIYGWLGKGEKILDKKFGEKVDK